MTTKINARKLEHQLNIKIFVEIIITSLKKYFKINKIMREKKKDLIRERERERLLKKKKEKKKRVQFLHLSHCTSPLNELGYPGSFSF